MYRDHRQTAAVPAGEIRRFFRSRRKHVISFAGFGELGYEEEGIVARTVRQVVADHRPDRLLVNAGTLLREGGHDGISRIYEVARGLGIETSGIHPGVALDFADTHRVSPYEQHPFFVDDESWGGFIDEDGQLSPTLRLILEVSDELVVVGGGKHAADELIAFARHGKPVRYLPAKMNEEAAREWHLRSGVDVGDPRGAAHRAWRTLTDVQPVARVIHKSS